MCGVVPMKDFLIKSKHLYFHLLMLMYWVMLTSVLLKSNAGFDLWIRKQGFSQEKSLWCVGPPAVSLTGPWTRKLEWMATTQK